MIDPIVQRNASDAAKPSPGRDAIRRATNSLSYQGVYSCPVCRRGEISAMPLMEAFACDFCRHIFTANLEKQVLKMADSSLPLSWYWNGRSWQGAHRAGAQLGWGIWVAALAFVLFPPMLVGIGAYIFPPLPGSRLSWLPAFWTGLTFFSHLACVGWLVVESYQFPVFAFLRVWRRRLLGSR